MNIRWELRTLRNAFSFRVPCIAQCAPCRDLFEFLMSFSVESHIISSCIMHHTSLERDLFDGRTQQLCKLNKRYIYVWAALSTITTHYTHSHIYHTSLLFAYANEANKGKIKIFEKLKKKRLKLKLHQNIFTLLIIIL